MRSFPLVPARLLSACLALGLAAVCATASAQTQPLPTLPSAGRESSQAPEGLPPDSDAVPEGSRPSSSDYSLGVGAGWESNVGEQASAGPSDWAGGLRGRLERDVRRPRREIRLTAGGQGYFYAEQTAFNRLDGNVGMEGDFRFSPRTGGLLAFGFDYGHSDTSRILIDQGILLPLTRTIGYTADAGLQHQVSTNVVLRGGARALRVDFPDSGAFRDSTSLRLSAGASRRLGQHDSLSLDLSAERADGAQTGVPDRSTAFWTQYGSVQWAHVLSLHTAFLLEAGTSYTNLAMESGLGRSWSFFGGASLNHRVRSTTLTAYYRREVLPTFGLGGLRLANRVGLNANAPVGASFSIGVGGNYVRDSQSSQSLIDPQSMIDASLTLSNRLASQLTLSLESRYRRQLAAAGIPALDDFRVGLFLSFVPPSSARPSGP